MTQIGEITSIANLEFKIESQEFEISILKRKLFALEMQQKMDASTKEVLTQLFIHGPLFDGYISSKNGRNQLVSLGLVERYEGFNFLNKDGVIVAIGIGLERVKEKRQAEISKALNTFRATEPV